MLATLQQTIFFQLKCLALPWNIVYQFTTLKEFSAEIPDKGWVYGATEGFAPQLTVSVNCIVLSLCPVQY